MFRLIKELIFLSIFCVVNSVMACPSGTSTSPTFTVNIDGCNYTYNICYECPFASSPYWFTIGTYHKVGQNCVSGTPISAIKDSLINRVLENSFFLAALCTGTIPPCGTGTVTWIQRDYDCWYKFNDAESGIEYKVCDFDSFCQREFEVCWTQGTGPVLGEPTAWYHIGDSFCDPQSIEPPDPDEGYSSSCWFNSICNP